MAPSLSLPDRFRTHVVRARLFRSRPPATAVAAVSGGADSVALLDLLHGVAPELGLTLVVAHADHGIQVESGNVGRMVRELAARYGLPFELGEPRVADDLRRLGRHAAEDRHAWDRALELATDLEVHVTPAGFDVARAGLRGYDDALAVALVRAATRRAGLVLGPARARRLLTLASRSSGRRMPLGGGWTAEVAFDRLRVSRVAKRGAGEVGEVLKVEADTDRGVATFGTFRVQWRPERAPARVERSGWTTWIDGSGWELRAPVAGDALVPLGGVGRRPLRRVLMDARVPRSERA